MSSVLILCLYLHSLLNIKISRKGVKTKELNNLKLKRCKQPISLVREIISSLAVYKLEHSHEALLFYAFVVNLSSTTNSK